MKKTFYIEQSRTSYYAWESEKSDKDIYGEGANIFRAIENLCQILDRRERGDSLNEIAGPKTEKSKDPLTNSLKEVP